MASRMETFEVRVLVLKIFLANRNDVVVTASSILLTHRKITSFRASLMVEQVDDREIE